ncbi:MAG: hypothetical protein HY901_06570, partial [Deltaproteobacteria bacterium]|nr:hypothetical protein [Deltaproteobacteria bacterium]
MLKQGALVLGLLLAAGCPGEEAGPDASPTSKRDASRPDAEEIIVGEDTGPGADTGPAVTDGGGGPAVGWCTLQFPPSATMALGAKVTVFGQVFVAGETEQAGARATIEGQVGYGPLGSDGSSDPGWASSWTNATFNADKENNDEYLADL